MVVVGACAELAVDGPGGGSDAGRSETGPTDGSQSDAITDEPLCGASRPNVRFAEMSGRAWAAAAVDSFVYVLSTSSASGHTMTRFTEDQGGRKEVATLDPTMVRMTGGRNHVVTYGNGTLAMFPAPVDVGSVRHVVSDPSIDPSVAIGPDAVYWKGRTDGVWSCRLAGCDAGTKLLTSTGTVGPAVLGSDLYFMGAYGGGPTDRLWVCPAGGCGGLRQEPVSGVLEPGSLAAAGPWLLMSSVANSSVYAYRPGSDAGVGNIGPQQADVSQLAGDAKGFYWMAGDRLMSRRAGATCVEVVDTGTNRSLFVTPNRLYWTKGNDVWYRERL